MSILAGLKPETCVL